jgi:hypothetical protein
LSEWCNAPSVIELWSQIRSNQPNSYINSQSVAIRRDKRLLSICTEQTTSLDHSRTLESKWEANWLIDLKCWELGIHSTPSTINRLFKILELHRRLKVSVFNEELGVWDVIVFSLNQFRKFQYCPLHFRDFLFQFSRISYFLWLNFFSELSLCYLDWFFTILFTSFLINWMIKALKPIC